MNLRDKARAAWKVQQLVNANELYHNKCGVAELEARKAIKILKKWGFTAKQPEEISGIVVVDGVRFWYFDQQLRVWSKHHFNWCPANSLEEVGRWLEPKNRY